MGKVYRTLSIIVCLTILALLFAACRESDSNKQISGLSTSAPPPEMQLPPPQIIEPAPVILPHGFRQIHTNGEIILECDTTAERFENCIILVKKSGIEISQCEFVNCSLLLDTVSEISLQENIFRDFSVPEKATANLYACRDISFDHNLIRDNTVGISVAESVKISFISNIFQDNYQHNALALYKSACTIRGNLFTYNFPHAVLAHFPPEKSGSGIDICGNIFRRNFEDAINFEDWAESGAASTITRNIITETNWAGINIEYNSWNADILIEGNHVSRSGYPVVSSGHSIEQQSGWQHGIKLEDCSGVTVKNNTVSGNSQNGIDIRNCRNILLQGNMISDNNAGIYSGGPDAYAFQRDISPLSKENAGPSQITLEGNYVNQNTEAFIRTD